MSKKVLGFSIIIMLVLAVAPVHAIKYVKSNAPGPTHDGSNWCKAYLTIQEALDVAADGEEVRVAGNATYNERIVFKSAAILRGGYRGNCDVIPPDLVRNPEVYVTVIDGGTPSTGSRTVTSHSTETIDGFTIRGSQTGLYIENASPRITGNKIIGHKDSQFGLYIRADAYCSNNQAYPNTCNPEVIGNEISDWRMNAIRCQSVHEGCLLSCAWGICSPTIIGNKMSGGDTVAYFWFSSPIFSDNTVSGGTKGILCHYGSAIITGNTLLAKGTGLIGIECDGDAWCYYYKVWEGSCTAVIDGNFIRGYSLYGVHCYATHEECRDNSGDGKCTPVISNNQILDSGQHGIVCNRATPQITGNSIIQSGDSGIYCCNNVSSESMASLTIDSNLIAIHSKGVLCDGVSVTVSNNNILLNKEGIVCQAGSQSKVFGNVLSSNKTGIVSSGGAPNICSNLVESSGLDGIVCRGGTPKIANNTIAKNAWYGIIVESGVPQVFNNIITGSPMGFCHLSGSSTLAKNNLWDNQVNYYGISKPSSDISVDPMFVAPALGEYHLKPGSPCIGAGDNTYVDAEDKDADGKERILPTGGTVDIGCFEWENPAVVPYYIRKPAQAKAMPQDYLIEMRRMPVTAAFDDFFYIENYDGSSGIRVEKTAHGITKGENASLRGVVMTNADGERYINASEASSSVGTLNLNSIGMNNETLGGGTFTDPASGIGQAGVQGGCGLNNIGLQVNIWGKVTRIDIGYLYIDDGSGLSDGTFTKGSENIGVRVICDPSAYAINDYLRVTGISSCFNTGSGIARRIITRTPEDIVKK